MEKTQERAGLKPGATLRNSGRERFRCGERRGFFTLRWPPTIRRRAMSFPGQRCGPRKRIIGRSLAKFLPNWIVPDVEPYRGEVSRVSKNVFEIARLPELAAMFLLTTIGGFLFECRYKLDEIGGAFIAVKQKMDVVRHGAVSDQAEFLPSGGSNQFFDNKRAKVQVTNQR